jgi:hypothetical protein
VEVRRILSHRTEAPDESRHPDLIVSDFAKGILPLCALGKLVCSIPQIGKHRDDLLHLGYLKYFNGALDQRSFLPNGIPTRRANIDAVCGRSERSAGQQCGAPRQPCAYTELSPDRFEDLK